MTLWRGGNFQFIKQSVQYLWSVEVQCPKVIIIPYGCQLFIWVISPTREWANRVECWTTLRGRIQDFPSQNFPMPVGCMIRDLVLFWSSLDCLWFLTSPFLYFSISVSDKLDQVITVAHFSSYGDHLFFLPSGTLKEWLSLLLLPCPGVSPRERKSNLILMLSEVRHN